MKIDGIGSEGFKALLLLHIMSQFPTYFQSATVLHSSRMECVRNQLVIDVVI